MRETSGAPFVSAAVAGTTQRQVRYMWGYRVAFTKIYTAPECPRWNTRAHRVTQLHPEPSSTTPKGQKRLSLSSILRGHYSQPCVRVCLSLGGLRVPPNPTTGQPSCSVDGCPLIATRGGVCSSEAGNESSQFDSQARPTPSFVPRWDTRAHRVTQLHPDPSSTTPKA